MTPRTPVLPLHRSKGFTLPELMITVAVAAILAALATPSFRTLVANQRIRTASFDLIANLALARSEAIKQNVNVTVASTSGTGAWANGWTISSAGGAIKSQPGYNGLTITAGGGAETVVYNRSGRVASTASVTFQISDARASVAPSCVVVGVSGQPTSRKGTC